MSEFEDIDRNVTESISTDSCSVCGAQSERLFVRYSFRSVRTIGSWLSGMKITGPFKPVFVYCLVISSDHTDVYLPMCATHFDEWSDSYDKDHRGLVPKHDVILEQGKDY